MHPQPLICVGDVRAHGQHYQHPWRSVILMILLLFCSGARGADPLPGTMPLTAQGDLSAQMVEGIDRFLTQEIEKSVAKRTNFWHPDVASHEAYGKSIRPNRHRFRKYIGAIDQRLPVNDLEFVSTTSMPAKIAESETYLVFAVRWPVFPGVFGTGLLLDPRETAVARIVAIPDADQTPEMLVGLAPGIAPDQQFARRFAENGCQVLVPVLIDRKDKWSGSATVGKFTNQPHREWIYRQAYEMGRHVIGYEVQTVSAAVDWFIKQNEKSGAKTRIGVAGYGEGGLIAFYSAAVDIRIQASLVSGYFDSRQKVWEEPIYRNVYGLLEEFGDAEVACLIAPRALVVEHSEAPKVAGPPPVQDTRRGAAPGHIATPDFNRVDAEVHRANEQLQRLSPPVAVELIHANEGNTLGPGSEAALLKFLSHLGVNPSELKKSGVAPADLRKGFDSLERQHQQIEELVGFTQILLSHAERTRNDFFWNKLRSANDPEKWYKATKTFKTVLWQDVLGKLATSNTPLNPRSRPAYESPKWTGYEVMLDVQPGVFAWGALLVPKGLKPDERRPVVVCQHGLEGVPEDTIADNVDGFKYYKAFSSKLAEQGFIVFAPHNPYRGEDKFRVLQRKANPLRLSLFSFILAQHERILDWLVSLPFVDPARIGFYGLSYGGKTAMRVPSLLERYSLSICSADFNDWIRKNVFVDSGYSYLFTGEYEMPEFNLGNTFNYAEMAALIAPRPFMVERGHDDGVAPDEWVAYEFARVRRLYDRLGIGEKTELEVFNGPHTINGVGTFEFLHKNLQWPER